MVTSPSSSPFPIRIRNFRKRYGKREAVRGLDLEVQRGEIYGLIGPDGAGKSSLMKAIAGVLTYDSGEVEIFGQLLRTEPDAESIKKHIGFMPQGLGLNLYPELSIEENIDFFARLRLVSNRDLAARKERLLTMTRLTEFKDRQTKFLSGGMKQKLGLVCTLIHEPDLVLLDEPTTGVDPVSRRNFWAILAQLLVEHNMTALISTAYMDEASRFHRLSLLNDGVTLAQGSPQELNDMVPGASSLEDVAIALLEKSVNKQATPSSISASAMVSSTPSSTQPVAIEAKHLGIQFGNFKAVDDVSFTVRSGEIFGLLGANGAGKTTVIKMLTGILPPNSGEGTVAGANMHTAGRTIKERIGYVSQAFSLYRDLTVAENIRLYASIYGLNRSRRAQRMTEILAMTELREHENDLASSLPMGLRQRLALGCALVHQPQILFLDEPTSGVDPIGRRQFWDLLFSLAQQDRVAILVTTHYMSEAENCDNVALMFAGKLIANDAPDALKAQVQRQAGHVLELALDRPTSALLTLQRSGYQDAALYGSTVHILTPDPQQDAQKIQRLLAKAGVQLIGSKEIPLTMEDVFVYRITQMEQQAIASENAGATS